MNRNFILGCLAGTIGGMLGTWMLLFVDIKISLRGCPVLNIYTEQTVDAETEEICSITDIEDGEDEYRVGVLVDDGLLEELCGGFKEKEGVDLVLIPDSHTDTLNEGKGVHVVISPVPTGDTLVPAKSIGLRLFSGKGDGHYNKK